jgi:7-cyano-7-deazaguanine reductase
MEISQSLLGRDVSYPKEYSPDVLFAINRSDTRIDLQGQVDAPLPKMNGFDLWQAYELSWLNQKGRPEVGRLSLFVPSDSLNMIESKSFKLYLNSFNNTSFKCTGDVYDHIKSDVEQLVGCECTVTIYSDVGERSLIQSDSNFNLAVNLDDLDVECHDFIVDPKTLIVDAGTFKKELVSTHLFRSCCPVTSQPDWASIYIEYHGNEIQRESLLKYLISYRNNQEFHEQCVERIYSELWQVCQPQFLKVAAFYLRRGGIDINPVRSSVSLPYFQTPVLLRQ